MEWKTIESRNLNGLKRKFEGACFKVVGQQPETHLKIKFKWGTILLIQGYFQGK